MALMVQEYQLRAARVGTGKTGDGRPPPARARGACFGGELPRLGRALQNHVMPTFARASHQLFFANMSQRTADTPALQEALKQDRPEFEDCTPCRVVGMPPLRPSLAAQPALTCPIR